MWQQLHRGETLTGTNTQETKHYNLEFWNSRIPLGSFHWIDYGGGSLSQPSNQENVQELTNYINNADCLFVCIDGKHLSSPVRNEDLTWIRNETKVNLILHYIRDFSRDKQQDFLPIVITISKYDLCLERITEEMKEEKIQKELKPNLNKNLTYEEREEIEKRAGEQLQIELQQEIEEEIRAIFEPLFAPGWLVMICPFTLGKDFGTATKQGYKPRIVPRNYHFPFVFALWAKLREDAWSIREELRQICDYEDNMVLEEREREWRELNDRRESLEEEYDKIISTINEKLIPYLKEAPIYKDGKSVQLSPLPQ